MKKRTAWAVVLCAWVLMINGGCGPKIDVAKEKKLTIYCGITMTKPMAEITKIIEQEEGCKINLIIGGSGNLLKSLKKNKDGDLFLPGSDSYIKLCIEEGLVDEDDTVFVGYNKASIMVQKGNPRKITNDLNNLTKEEYDVVIGNPYSGSIGRETKKILLKRGIYEEVLDNVDTLTTDSKDLVLVLKDKEADIVVNWYAVAIWGSNKPYIDVLPIKEEYASKKKLILGLLNTSKHPPIARRFIEYASSEKGKALFSKYGLYDVK